MSELDDQRSDLEDLIRPEAVSMAPPPAAAADTPASSSSSLDDLVPKPLMDDLTGLQRQKMKTDTMIEDRTRERLDLDRQDMARWHERAGQSVDDVKKWDAEAEKKKYAYDPIEAFGSFASVFAIAASAFTKTPMENALNGAAAAMNSIRAGKHDEYEQAFSAWKENTALAIKRGDMMHRQYDEALGLMNTDYRRGEIEMAQAARRFGDSQVLAMMEAGMNEKAFEVIAKRNAAVQGMAQADQAITKDRIQKQVYEAEVKGFEAEKDPVKKAGYTLDAFNRIYGGHKMTNPGLEIMGQAMIEHAPGTKDPWTPEQLADFAKQKGLLPYANRGTSMAARDAQLEEDETQHNIELGMPPLEAREDAKRKVKALGAVQTPGRDNLKLEAEKAAEIKKANPNISDADAKIQAKEEIKRATSTPTGNRLDDMKRRINQIKYADETLAQVETMLKKHNVITGLGGKLIGRPTEVMSNVLGGSSSTDYKQFESFIHELQMEIPRILTDSQGRPLGAEASHILQIVRGLNAGDTKANTLRSFSELRKQLREMSTDTEKRLKGEDKKPSAATAEEPPAQAGDDVPRWKRFGVPVN